MQTFTFNTDAVDPTSSLVASAANPSPVQRVYAKLGELAQAQLFLAKPSNPAATGYDATSGDSGTSIVACIGSSVALPTAGSYVLSWISAYTSAIVYNSTAAVIQTALSAIPSLTGNIQVTGQFPSYNVQFINSLGLQPIALLQVNSSLLSANGVVAIGRVQAGSSIQNEIQSITLQVLPPVYQTSWTVVTDSGSNNIGWTGSLNFSSAALIQQFTPGQPYVDETLEFTLTDSNGYIKKYSCPITIYNSPNTLTGNGSGNTSDQMTGTALIPSGSSQVVVSGLNLSKTPTSVIATVSAPTGGLNLFATVDIGSITSQGFTANLDGQTDSTGYKLVYSLNF